MGEHTLEYDGEDAEDVKNALKRETDDGAGDTEPGESDFKGFATDGVENETGDETNDPKDAS